MNGKKWNGGGILTEGTYIFTNGTGLLIEYNDIICQSIFKGMSINGERKQEGVEINVDGKYNFYGKYLKGKRIKGKEINKEDGKIIFEGEYINGNKYKGKGYIKERLDYEGEFLFDKKWNIKGYDENGNIIYEIKEGKGKIKEFNNEGALIFEGELLNGDRNGFGKEFNSEGKLIFEGEYLNGNRNGYGKQYNKNGEIEFEGEYLNGEKWNGKGKIFDKNNSGAFEGEILNGKFWNDIGKLNLGEGLKIKMKFENGDIKIREEIKEYFKKLLGI